MVESIIFNGLIIVSIIIIIYLIYLLLKRPKPIIVYNELPPEPRFKTQWWGYGWRPWWRKYDGLPGLTYVEPTPVPMPPPKPIIIPKS